MNREQSSEPGANTGPQSAMEDGVTPSDATTLLGRDLDMLTECVTGSGVDGE